MSATDTDACGLVVEACICGQPPGHADPHLCGCGGSWTYAADGTFVVVAFPGGAEPSVYGMLQTLDTLIGRLP